jgi:hypothetical protein
VMGWTETEQLLCVFDGGIVRMYNILGESTQFSLGKANDRIVDVQDWLLSQETLTGFCMKL